MKHTNENEKTHPRATLFIACLCAVAVAVAIYVLTEQPPDVTSSESDFVERILTRLFSGHPRIYDPDAGRLFGIHVRHWAHVFEFGALGLFVALASVLAFQPRFAVGPGDDFKKGSTDRMPRIVVVDDAVTAFPVADLDAAGPMAFVSDPDATGPMAPVADSDATGPIAPISSSDPTGPIARISESAVTSSIAPIAGEAVTQHLTWPEYGDTTGFDQMVYPMPEQQAQQEVYQYQYNEIAERKPKLRILPAGITALVICAACSLFDQCHKLFVPGRHFDYVDLFMDAFGYGCAIVFVLLVTAIVRHRRFSSR